MTTEERKALDVVVERENAAYWEQVETPEGYYRYLKKHNHPSLRKIEEQGGATIINGPNGCIWVGSTDAPVEISSYFMRYAKSSTSIQWPPSEMVFSSYGDDICMKCVGVSSDRSKATYKRAY